MYRLFLAFGLFLSLSLATAGGITRAADADGAARKFIVIRRGAKVMKGETTLATLDHGLELKLTEEKGAWLWTPRFRGWINKRYLIAREDALTELSKRVRAEPRSAGAYINRAAAWQVKGETANASADLNEAIRLDPANALAYASRGHLRLKAADYERAIRDFTEAIRLDENYVRPVIERGVAYRESGAIDRALEDHERAVRMAERNSTCYTQRGRSRLAKGDLAGAIGDFDLAIKLSPSDPHPRYERGNAYLSSGDLAKALADAEVVLKHDARHPEGLLLRARTYRQQRQLEKALADINTLLAANANSPAALLERADVYAIAGKLDESLADLTSAIRIQPNNGLHFYYRSILWERKGDAQNALSDMNEAIRLDPQRGAFYERRGTLWEAQGDRTKALQDLDQALRTNRTSNTYRFRGDLRRRAGNFPAAIEDYTEAIRLNPKNGVAYNNRGLAHELNKQFDKAIEDYSVAVRLSPGEWLALSNRAILWRDTGSYDKADADFSEVIARQEKAGDAVAASQRARTYFLRATNFHRAGKLPEALADYNKALELDPEYADAYNSRGLAWQSQRQFDNAVNDFSQAIRLSPESPIPYRNRGEIYRIVGKYEEAIRDLSKAVQLAPNDAATINNRGLSWASMREYDKAIQDFTQALRLRPKESILYANRADALRKKGETQKAIEDYNEAIRLNPKYITAYNQRAMAWQAMGQYDKAIQDFSVAIRLDPKSSVLVANRADAWKAKGNAQKAYDDYSKAIELDPSNLSGYKGRAQVLKRMGQMAAAIEDLNTAIAADPKNADSYNQRGLAHMLIGDYEKAVQDFNQVITLVPKALVGYANRGDARRSLKEFEKAHQDLEQALKLNPKSPLALRGRAELWADQGEFAKALDDVNRAIELAPDYADALNLRAFLTSVLPDEKFRNGKQAVEDAQKACQLTGMTKVKYLATLAAAHAESGNYAKAIEFAEKALSLSGNEDNSEVEAALTYYRANKPYRLGAEPLIVMDPAPKVDLADAVPNAISTDFVPIECFGAVIFHPRAVLDSSLGAMLPIDSFWETISNGLDLDPRTIKEILVVMFPHPDLPPGGIVRFSAPVLIEQAHAFFAGKGNEPARKTIGSHTYYVPMNDDAYCLIGDNVLLVAPEDTLVRMLAVDESPSLLRNTLRQTSATDAFRLVVELKAARQFFSAEVLPALAGEGGDAAGQLVDVPALVASIEHLDQFMFSVALEPRLTLQVDAAMDSPEAATAAKSTLETALAAVQRLFSENKESIAAALGKPHPHGAKLARVADDTLQRVRIGVSGSSVSVRVAAGEPFSNWLRDAKPLMDTLADRSRDHVRLNRARQIGLALHNHHDTYGRFPAAAICDDAGKPLLSWRVKILPFLDEDELFKKFHLDEPWDSPHNRTLVDQIPDVYRNQKGTDNGKTRFVVYTGEETAFQVNSGRTYADFKDGLSNTLFGVEVAPEKAVTWTKPEDLVFDRADPKTCLGLGKADRFLVLLADGAALWLPASLDVQTLRKLVERADGEVFTLPDDETGPGDSGDAPPPPPPGR